jgi:hypothetical protein
MKRRLGNPGKRPLPTVVSTVEPIDGFPRFDSGSSLLKHVLDNGGSEWIGKTDVAAILLIDLYDDWLSARTTWQSSARSDDFKAYDSLTGRLQTCLATLGLNPADRGRLGLAKVQAKATGLAALRQERALKAGRPAG